MRPVYVAVLVGLAALSGCASDNEKATDSYDHDSSSSEYGSVVTPGRPRDAGPGNPEATTPAGADYMDLVDNAFAGISFCTAQEKVLCKTAAEADALAALVREVRGAWVSSSDVINRAVVEASTRNVETSAFVRGAKFVDFRMSPDGLCTAKVRITLDEFVRSIAVQAKLYEGGREVGTREVIEKMNPKSVTATGNGACKGEFGAPRTEEPQDTIPGEIR